MHGWARTKDDAEQLARDTVRMLSDPEAACHVLELSTTEGEPFAYLVVDNAPAWVADRAVYTARQDDEDDSCMFDRERG